MRTTYQFISAIVGCLMSAAQAHAQGGVAGTLQKDPQSSVAGTVQKVETIKEFQRTAEGDWQTVVTPKDGAPFVYTFVPGTKVAPIIEVKLDRVPGQARFRYQYQLSNGMKARQEFAVMSLSISRLVAVRELPDGWVNERRAGEGSVAIRGPLMTGGVPSGVPPGGSLSGFSFEGPVLPGVTLARCRGNTKGVVEVPPGLSDAQRRELLEISKVPTVSAPIIAPIIGVGVGEPELQPSVLLARIGANYVSAFSGYQHPYASALDQAFTAVYAVGNTVSAPALQAALKRVADVAQQPVKDPWHQQMSTALQFCIRMVQEGVVPTPRLAEASDLSDH
jgi:hypothetical protein